MLYFSYLRMLLRSAMQYKLGTWMIGMGQFLVAFFAYLGIALLFERFDTIDGWTFHEVAFCFGTAHISFSLTEMFMRGFEAFSRIIVDGGFDRILLRPRGTFLQILGSAFSLERLGNLLQGCIVLGIALSGLEAQWTASRVFTALLMILGSIGIFSGLFMLSAVFCFFTIQGLEVVNIFTHGGQEMASYPISIYSRWMVRFFTFIIPIGFTNYFPLLYITGREDGLLYMLCPVIGLLFFFPCLLAWHMGVRRYASTGS